MNEHIGGSRVAQFKMANEDGERYARGQKFGVLGMVCLIVGATGTVATMSQPNWDIARTFYLLLVLLGPLCISYGRKIHRPLMKKYLRQFHFVSWTLGAENDCSTK